MLEFESRTSKIKFTSYRVLGGGVAQRFPGKVLIKIALIAVFFSVKVQIPPKIVKVSYVLGIRIISNRYIVVTPGRRPGTMLV